MGQLTNYFVAPGTGSVTGSGTLASPWTGANVVQHALDNITRDTTNGDRINVQANGSIDLLTAELDFSTYGAPTIAVPLYIEGYTTVQGDGGVGKIKGAGGAASVYAGNGVSFVFLDIDGNQTSGDIVDGNDIYMTYCTVHGGSAGGIKTSAYSSILYTHVYDIGGWGISGSTALRVIGCKIEDTVGAANTMTYGITFASYNAIVGNIIIINSTAGRGMHANGAATTIAHNTIVNLTAGTNTGIFGSSARYELYIFNNIVAGFSGTGGDGIVVQESYVAHNAVYNCTHPYVITDDRLSPHDNVTLTADPFVDLANRDLRINPTVTEVQGNRLAYNTAIDSGDLGAIQLGAGGGVYPIFKSSIIRAG